MEETATEHDKFHLETQNLAKFDKYDPGHNIVMLAKDYISLF